MIARDAGDGGRCGTMLRNGFNTITEGDHKGSPLRFGVTIAIVVPMDHFIECDCPVCVSRLRQIDLIGAPDRLAVSCSLQ